MSTRIRPNKEYKNDRADLNGAGLHDGLLTSGVFGSPFHADYKKGVELFTARDLFKTPTKQEKLSRKERVRFYKEQYKKAKAAGYKGSYTSYAKKIGWVEKPSFTFPGFRSGSDIHKVIGKFPQPKAGFTPSKYKYMGPYNPLDKQLKYDPNTGEVEWYVQP